MRARWRLAAVVFLPIVGLAALVWLGRGGPPVGAPQPAASPPAPAVTPSPAGSATARGMSLPPFALEQGRITGADAAGRVQWELQAASLETVEARQEVTMTQVVGKFYERGQLVVTVSAPRAVLSAKTQDVTLTGGVHARGTENRTLEAERVEWLTARRLLIASGHVRLTQDRYVVLADRLESDIGLRRTKLRGNIRVTVRE